MRGAAQGTPRPDLRHQGSGDPSAPVLGPHGQSSDVQGVLHHGAPDHADRRPVYLVQAEADLFPGAQHVPLCGARSAGAQCQRPPPLGRPIVHHDTLVGVPVQRVHQDGGFGAPWVREVHGPTVCHQFVLHRRTGHDVRGGWDPVPGGEGHHGPQRVLHRHLGITGGQRAVGAAGEAVGGP